MNSMNEYMKDVQLSELEDTELRADVIQPDGGSYSWNEAIDVYEYSMELARNDNSLIPHVGSGSALQYSPEYDQSNLERVKLVQSGLKTQTPLLYTHELRLAGSPIDSNGDWMPPADFTNSLLESWSDVRQTFYDKAGSGYVYLRLLDATSTGYPCVRLILLIDDKLSQSACEAIIQSHVDNSPVAHENDHLMDRSIRVDRTFDLETAIGQNLSVFGDNRDDSWQNSAFHALLWSMNLERFTFSKSAKEYCGELNSFSPSMDTVSFE